jgi:hypothetical protein
MSFVKIIACVCAFLVSAIPIAAQPADAKPVQEAVEAFLLHLGEGEFDKVAADLSAKALIVVVRQQNNDWNNTYQTGEAWVASLKGNANFAKFREPISNVKVTVDSGRQVIVARRRSIHPRARGRHVEARRRCVHVVAGPTVRVAAFQHGLRIAAQQGPR